VHSSDRAASRVTIGGEATSPSETYSRPPRLLGATVVSLVHAYVWVVFTSLEYRDETGYLGISLQESTSRLRGMTKCFPPRAPCLQISEKMSYKIPTACPQGLTETPILCLASSTGKLPVARMDTVYDLVPTQRLIDLLALLQTRFNATYDRARTVLFFYVVVKYGVKSLRHVRARGTLETFKEVWGWLSEVRCHRFCRVFPANPDTWTLRSGPCRPCPSK